ncbi:MAG: type III pantothenate kinase [Burkholderiaceae bacterium]|jgi:type III pantothenate kinase|nr:type III pantothenate kinase [Burkholderiaceae bacterium]
MAFLAIDIGNTRLKWALYEGPRLGAALLAHGVEFLDHIERLAEGAWARLPAAPDTMLGCAVAADPVRRRAEEQIRERFDCEPHWVVPDETEAGLVNGYDHPSRLGADRWVAMIGARHRLLREGPPRPLIVVMIGTAVTVDAVDTEGRFLGGLILPGHGIMLRALESGTAGLHVPTGEVAEFPTNTSDALTSGGTYAIAGAVDRMVRHLRRRCGGAEPVRYLSGGAGWKMAPSMLQPFELIEGLIMDGLLSIAEQRAGTRWLNPAQVLENVRPAAPTRSLRA